jgi:hypothetical protein
VTTTRKRKAIQDTAPDWLVKWVRVRTENASSDPNDAKFSPVCGQTQLLKAMIQDTAFLVAVNRLISKWKTSEALKQTSLRAFLLQACSARFHAQTNLHLAPSAARAEVRKTVKTARKLAKGIRYVEKIDPTAASVRFLCQRAASGQAKWTMKRAGLRAGYYTSSVPAEQIDLHNYAALTASLNLSQLLDAYADDLEERMALAVRGSPTTSGKKKGGADAETNYEIDSLVRAAKSIFEFKVDDLIAATVSLSRGKDVDPVQPGRVSKRP